MPTTDQLGFEVERRVIILHRDTSMPDDTQLGYIGDPNNAINGNSDGETLLYNSPSGTAYIDKGSSLHERWAKVQDGAGGLWELDAGEDVEASLVEIETFDLIASDITAMYVQLLYQPLYAEDVKLTVKNAPTQQYGDDYKQNATFLKQITWEGLALENILSIGDKLTITYVR